MMMIFTGIIVKFASRGDIAAKIAEPVLKIRS